MHIGYKDYAHFVDSHKFWFPDVFEESEEEEETEEEEEEEYDDEGI